MKTITITPKQHLRRLKSYWLKKSPLSYKTHAKALNFSHPFYMRDKLIAKIITHKRYVIYEYQ